MSKSPVIFFVWLVLFASLLTLDAADQKPLPSSSNRSATGETKSAFTRKPDNTTLPPGTPPPDQSGAENLGGVVTPSKALTLQDLAVFQLAFFCLALLIFFPLIWMRTRKTDGNSNAPLGLADLRAISDNITAVISPRMTQTDQHIRASEANIKRVLSDMGPQLVSAVAKAAALEVNKTQLGDVTAKCQKLEENLKNAVLDVTEERAKTSTANSERDQALALKERSDELAKVAVGEKEEVERKLSELRKSLEEVNTQLTSVRGDVERLNKELAAERIKIGLLHDEARKGYDLLAPAKLKDTDLNVQMFALFQESLAGSAASIAAWTTLTAFVSAEADPSAKDFQLQIVRRLGFTLVSYWKQQGISEKDRHDKLTLWAKSLNEHADGRFNLLVPALGAPIDRTRMACSSSATAIREVLCWQVRNPAGANFSLAEVA